MTYSVLKVPLNPNQPTNQHGRRVWSLARMSLKVMIKVKGQGHQGQKTAFFGLCML